MGADTSAGNVTHSDMDRLKCPGVYSGIRPRYMTPAEVREVLKRMWRNNTGILSMLYAVENKHVPRSSKIHSNYEDIYEMFFIQTVPVAPNKFRAPSKLGDQVFEHPQNTLLVTIINANLDLVTYSNKASTEPVDGNQVSHPPHTLTTSNNMDRAVQTASLDTTLLCCNIAAKSLHHWWSSSF